MYGINYLISGGGVHTNIIPFFSGNSSDKRGRFYYVFIYGDDTESSKVDLQKITYGKSIGKIPRTDQNGTQPNRSFVTHEFIQFIADTAKRHSELQNNPEVQKKFLQDILNLWPQMKQGHRNFYNENISIVDNNNGSPITFDELINKDSYNVDDYTVGLSQQANGSNNIEDTVFYLNLPNWDKNWGGFVWPSNPLTAFKVSGDADPFRDIYKAVYDAYSQGGASGDGPLDIVYDNRTVTYTPNSKTTQFTFGLQKLNQRTLQEMGNLDIEQNDDDENNKSGSDDDGADDSDSDSDSDSNKFKNLFRVNNGRLEYANGAPAIWRDGNDHNLQDQILNNLGATKENCANFELKDGDQCDEFLGACFTGDAVDTPYQINKCIEFIINNDNFASGSNLAKRVEKISLNHAFKLLKRIGVRYKIVKVNGQEIKRLESIKSWQSRLDTRDDITDENVKIIKKQQNKLNFFSLLIQLVNAHPALLNKDYKADEPCDDVIETIEVDRNDIYSNYIPARVDIPYGQNIYKESRAVSGVLFGGAFGQNIAKMIAANRRQRSLFSNPAVPTFIVNSNTLSPSVPFNRSGPMYGCTSSCNKNKTVNMGNIDIMNFNRNKYFAEQDDDFDCGKIESYITTLLRKLGARKKTLSTNSKNQLDATLIKFKKIKKKLAKYSQVLKNEEKLASVLNDNADAQINFKNKNRETSQIYNLLNNKYENSKSNIYSLILALEDAVNNIGKDKDYTNDGKTFELKNNNFM